MPRAPTRCSKPWASAWRRCAPRAPSRATRPMPAPATGDDPGCRPTAAAASPGTPETAMTRPTVTYGLLNTHVHVAARLRGEAVGVPTGLLGTGIAGAALLSEALGETRAAARDAVPGAYAAPGAAAAAG